MVQVVVFTDFDGTITLQDSYNYLADDFGCGKDERERTFGEVFNGTSTFRETFHKILESVELPFDECVKILKDNVQLDTGFRSMYDWCIKEQVPLVVVSGGIRLVIEELLEQHLGKDALKNIEIYSNDVVVNDDGSWSIVYRDDSHHGHDKARSIDLCKQRFNQQMNTPVYLYCGDGVSDVSAAKECDLLFAKRGKDLVTYCDREGILYHEFDTFENILECVKRVTSGEISVQELTK
ncbi:putative phosphoric monoester hydrolase Ecym_1307 [Eremothecium cymbalariae DBVPG|uniref:2,3-diketo-5-methylthio-1-phosphopentane phosphatase n=1 Tax=Eremothecium cymbalariae (strain CBS 270.75 / DBVPG 7215 / KCTC 17166 / NRRL Y-17582) TaxID=931890 RepID=G8JN81_ERECY|nr:hypothetical protein Ecym_1307 [Eremothecium cymbalariae DBVPG\